MSEFHKPRMMSLITTNFDKSWTEYCPKCRKQVPVAQYWDMENAYGCFDGTVQLQLECSHTLMPWERRKKK